MKGLVAKQILEAAGMDEPSGMPGWFTRPRAREASDRLRDERRHRCGDDLGLATDRARRTCDASNPDHHMEGAGPGIHRASFRLRALATLRA